ncbi:dynamin family protein [Actinomycetospora aeridis]|uniref:Dynamin family protein n=1 Tax=Actinomycetospora aeridis TaxID=3129231 RepID=A0ABU8N7N8_9PSEU
MTGHDEPLVRAEEIRQQTAAVLDEMNRQATTLELPAPDPPEALEQARAVLEQNSYQVLFVGEAKSGKSSLVNALVGRDILPTDVAVATSQVFRVSAAEREAYRLRFEDDSVQEIAADDLPRYGSQVLADAGAAPTPASTIRWIEVDLPGLRFLPDGVSLLDTPGLGALYSAHQEITQRFVPLADAVVLVLDSERPIVTTELDAVATVLEATGDVFFVQTKSDLVGVDQCRSVRERSEQLLRERFPQLAEVSVLPFSNTLLRAAALDDEDAQENLEDSGHIEMEAALRRFLFVVAGWRRTASALGLAGAYQRGSTTTLAARAEALREAAEVQARLEMRRAVFTKEWGPRGSKSTPVVTETKKTVQRAVKSLRQTLTPHGKIVAAHRDTIEAATSVKALEALNDELPARLAADLQAEFRQTAGAVDNRIAELLAPLFDEGADRWVAADSVLETDDLSLSGRRLRDTKGVRWEKIASATMQGGIASTAGTTAFYFAYGGLSSAVAMGSLTVATGGTILIGVGVVALAGTLWASAHGWRRAGGRRVQATRQDVTRNLVECAGMLQTRLFDGDFADGREGLVETHFAQVEAQVFETLKTTVKRKEEEGLAEQKRLEEAAGLDADQRKARGAELAEQRRGWDALADRVEALSAELEELLSSMNRGPATGDAG